LITLLQNQPGCNFYATQGIVLSGCQRSQQLIKLVAYLTDSYICSSLHIPDAGGRIHPFQTGLW